MAEPFVLPCKLCGEKVNVYGGTLRPQCPNCRSRQWWMRDVKPVAWKLTEWDLLCLKCDRIAVEDEDLPGWQDTDLAGSGQVDGACPRTHPSARADRRARLDPTRTPGKRNT